MKLFTLAGSVIYVVAAVPSAQDEVPSSTIELTGQVAKGSSPSTSSHPSLRSGRRLDPGSANGHPFKCPCWPDGFQEQALSGLTSEDIDKAVSNRRLYYYGSSAIGGGIEMAATILPLQNPGVSRYISASHTSGQCQFKQGFGGSPAFYKRYPDIPEVCGGKAEWDALSAFWEANGLDDARTDCKDCSSGECKNVDCDSLFD